MLTPASKGDPARDYLLAAPKAAVRNQLAFRCRKEALQALGAPIRGQCTAAHWVYLKWRLPPVQSAAREAASIRATAPNTYHIKEPGVRFWHEAELLRCGR